VVPRRDVGKPSSLLGVAVHTFSGDFRDRRPVSHRGEFRGARIPTAGRWPFPRSRHGLGPSLAGGTDLRGPCLSALPEGTGWCRPLLAFASCVDSVAASLPHLPPRGSAARVHARPLPSGDCRAVVPSHQRSIRRCRAPGGAAGGQVPHPSPKGGKSPTRGPAGVSRVPCLRLPAHTPCGAAAARLEHLPRASSTPRFLVSRRPGSPPKEVVPDPTGSRGATASGGPRRVLPDSSHGWSQRLPFRRLPCACPLPARCRPRPNEVPTEVDRSSLPAVPTCVPSRSKLLLEAPSQTASCDHHDFTACLRPPVAKPTVPFRPCRFSRLRRLAPRTPCRSVAPCCRPWGSPGCRPQTWATA